MKEIIISGQNMTLSEEQKKQKRIDAELAYGSFLTALGYDWQSDPNMEGTPRRVAKMYIDEVTKGSYNDMPRITAFENRIQYDGMVFQGGITVKSLCSHHMQPFIGVAHVAYIVGTGEESKVIGLSKLNRIVDYFARRPQLQEQLTKQIHDKINEIIPNNRGIAVVVKAKHMCVSLRGIEHENSEMQTAKMSGFFFKNEIGTRDEFYRMIADLKK